MDLTANEKRSLALKGKYFPHKDGNYKPAVWVTCGTCGKRFRKKYSLARKVKHHYCSKECNQTIFKKGQKPSNYLGNKAYRVVHCTYCGEKIKRRRKEAERYKRHFCNQRCAGRWKAENLVGSLVYNWKGGYDPYYGENWRVQRYKCRIRDKNICQICSKAAKKLDKNLDVDHRIPFEAFNGNWKEANRLSNLWCLCPSCHTKKTNWQAKYGKLSYEDWKPLIKKWYP